MALITREGYGQVEFNHVSSQRTGEIYAQLPALSADFNGVGPTVDELTALLDAVDSLEGAESGSVLMAVSNGVDTLIVDVNLDENLADADRVDGVAYLESTVASDLTADNLYDFSALTANT